MNEILASLIDGGMGMMALAFAMYLVVSRDRTQREVLEPLIDRIKALSAVIERLTGPYRGPGE